MKQEGWAGWVGTISGWVYKAERFSYQYRETHTLLLLIHFSNMAVSYKVV